MRIIRWKIRSPGKITYAITRYDLHAWLNSRVGPYSIIEQELEVDFHKERPTTTKVSEKVFKEVQ
jgi:hypothetical protein